MALKMLWVLFFFVFAINSIAQDRSTCKNGRVSQLVQKHKHGEIKAENKKITAIALGISLGIFGVHRLYLGTAEHIPLVYGLTLGGAGIITLTDIVAIAVTRDLGKYENNPKVFMWNGNDNDSVENP